VLGSAAALGAWLVPDAPSGVALWYFALVSYLLVLANLNPVLEHDGYYVLIDLVDRPTLRTDTLAWLRRGLIPALWSGRELRGHAAELLYALGGLAYIALIAGLALTVVRSVAQRWLAHVLPRLAAMEVAWILAVLIVVLTVSAALATPHGAGAAARESPDPPP
jgi:hypothetical protein